MTVLCGCDKKFDNTQQETERKEFEKCCQK